MTLREKIEAKNGLLFVAPWMIGFTAFVAFPILAAFVLSFTEYSLLSRPVFVGLDNYAEIFRTPVAYRAIVRTVLYASVAIPVSLAVSLALALLLERQSRGVGIYRTAIFLPALVPQVAVAALLLWIFASDGIVNRMLDGIGLGAVPWLRRDMILVTLLLAGVWTVGHQVVIFTAGLQDVPQELYESAEIDGANYLQRVLSVSVPMISPVILFNMVMGIIIALGQFTIPYFIASGNAQQDLGDSANFIATQINQDAMRNLRMGYASALSCVLFVAVIILTALVLRLSTRVVHYRGE
jgi:multiple sugar transport system permease protein